MILEPIGVAGFVGSTRLAIPPRTQAVLESSGRVGLAWLLEMDPVYRQTGVVSTSVIGGSGIDPLGISGISQPYTLTRTVAVPAPTRRYVSTAEGLADIEGWIEPLVNVGDLRVRRELPVTGERLSGFVAATSARIYLSGKEGQLDDLLTQQVMRDRPVRLSSAITSRSPQGIERAPPRDQFGLVFAGRATDVQISNEDRVQVFMADDFSRLDRSIQQNLYTGTGGLQGDEAVAGKPRPLAYGVCLKAAPTLIDRLRGIFQVHDGAYVTIRVYDRGEPLQPVAEVQTYEELEALTTEGEVDEPDIPAGFYAACRPLGLFRIGGAYSVVTVDVEGDGLRDGLVGYTGNVLYLGGVGYAVPGSNTFNRYAGGMILRILRTRASFAASEIDIDRIREFDDTFPYEVGIFIGSDQRPTVREVCTRISDSVNAVILRNRVGAIFLRALESPGGSSTIKGTQLNIGPGGVERLALPWGAPWNTVQVRYARNWRPLTVDETSAALAQEEAAEVQRETSITSATDESMAQLVPDRQPLEIDSILVRKADAEAVAQAILRFYSPIWALYRARLRGIPFRADVLSNVVITYPRHDLRNGKGLLVLAIDEQPGIQSTELLLVG